MTVTFQREPGEKNEAADAAIAAAQWSATTKTDTAVTSVPSSDMDTTPQEASKSLLVLSRRDTLPVLQILKIANWHKTLSLSNSLFLFVK